MQITVESAHIKEFPNQYKPGTTWFSLYVLAEGVNYMVKKGNIKKFGDDVKMKVKKGSVLIGTVEKNGKYHNFLVDDIAFPEHTESIEPTNGVNGKLNKVREQLLETLKTVENMMGER